MINQLLLSDDTGVADVSIMKFLGSLKEFMDIAPCQDKEILDIMKVDRVASLATGYFMNESNGDAMLTGIYVSMTMRYLERFNEKSKTI